MIIINIEKNTSYYILSNFSYNWYRWNDGPKARVDKNAKDWSQIIYSSNNIEHANQLLHGKLFESTQY